MNDDFMGIIAPHPPIMVAEVGGRDSSVTSASTAAMAAAADIAARFSPDVIVLMSPHAPYADDAFAIDDSPRTAGDLGRFGAPMPHLSCMGDPALAKAIAQAARTLSIPTVMRSSMPRLEPGTLDHAAIVPLSFISRDCAWPIVELSLTWLPLQIHRAFGQAVRSAAAMLGRRTLFLASGDCSHRLTTGAPAGYDPHGIEFDRLLVDILERGDYEALQTIDPLLIEAAGECGLRSFVTLGGFLDGLGTRTEVLSYEGPWGVGYLTAVAASPELLSELSTPARGRKGGFAGQTESAPVAFARRVIDAYIRERRVIEPTSAEGLPDGTAGVFVSLHRGGELRGCIGTIAPTRSTLAEEIVYNAIQASTADPRFPSLTTGELDDLDISVDILHAPEPAEFADLDPRRFGVIVEADWRRGLLLPDLEGVDTAAEQVAIARRKAGIGPSEHVTLERFLVDRYS